MFLMPLVCTGLDSEEQQFKQQLEMQGGDIDKLFNFEGDDNLAFDDAELGHISMLNAYRSHLVANAEKASPSASSDASAANAATAGPVARARDCIKSQSAQKRKRSDRHHKLSVYTVHSFRSMAVRS
jgi:hypothetical protein